MVVQPTLSESLLILHNAKVLKSFGWTESRILYRFFCQEYEHRTRWIYSKNRSTDMMDIQISKKLNLKKKEVDDVLGGEDAWKNVDRTQGMSDFLY